ncbi:MAG TPA: NAD-dependent epimerase/dehydratase family protein [Pseudonocardiaceae bacterium]|jgi:nucleoside-diphosphate-sugar epimerase
MSLHVIVGAGPVGSGTAQVLAEAGHDVRLISRSGRRGATGHPRIEPVAADATDAAALRELTTGAAALYNCANPPYHRWPQDWPPIAGAMLAAAEHTGAVLVIMGNLYGYGPVDSPMSEDTPLAATGTKGRVRAGMWADALAAHRSGRIRATEARASDFYGPHIVSNAMIGERFVPSVLAGRPVYVLGDPDAPHTWSYLPDVANTLAVLGTDERAWGRAWHVPSPPPLSQRALARGLAELAGAREPRLRRIPHVAVRAAGLFSPLMRELRETSHQFARSFVMDSSAFTARFGLEASPLDDALKATVAWWQARAGRS